MLVAVLCHYYLHAGITFFLIKMVLALTFVIMGDNFKGLNKSTKR